MDGVIHGGRERVWLCVTPPTQQPPNQPPKTKTPTPLIDESFNQFITHPPTIKPTLHPARPRPLERGPVGGLGHRVGDQHGQHGGERDWRGVQDPCGCVAAGRLCPLPRVCQRPPAFPGYVGGWVDLWGGLLGGWVGGVGAMVVGYRIVKHGAGGVVCALLDRFPPLSPPLCFLNLHPTREPTKQPCWTASPRRAAWCPRPPSGGPSTPSTSSSCGTTPTTQTPRRSASPPSSASTWRGSRHVEDT